MLYNPDKIVPINVSKAADEDNPAPINTSLVTYALKPPTSLLPGALKIFVYSL